MAKKDFLDKEGARYLVQLLLKEIQESASDENFTTELKAKLQGLENYSLPAASSNTLGGVKVGSGLAINDGILSANGVSSFNDLLDKPTTLAGYGISDAATVDDIERLEGVVTGVYHFKGSVADLTALEAIENPEVGDTYNIEATGMNAAWTGEAWDEFGSVVDLSEYLKEAEVEALTKEDIDAIFMKYSSLDVDSAAGITSAFATEGDTINVKLTNNMTVSNNLVVAPGKTATLDLGSATLNLGTQTIAVQEGATLTITGDGEITSASRPVIAYGGDVEIEGGHIVSTSDCAITISDSGSVHMTDGYVQAQEAGILALNGGSVVIDGGSVSAIDNGAIMGNGTAGAGDTDITINGGYFEGNITSNGYVACTIYHPNTGTLTINGGEIVANGGAGIVMRGGQLNFNGGTIVANTTEARPSGSVGKVGDSRVVVGIAGIVYDKNSKYPGKDTLEVNINGGSITGADYSLQVLTDEAEPAISIANEAILTPAYSA